MAIPEKESLAGFYDIAIVGGGMVGAALALALARGQVGQSEPLRIVVFEAFALPQADNQPRQPSYDDRSTAISLGSRHLFEGLGIWPELAVPACPIQKIQVSDRGHPGAARLDAAKEQVPALGYVLENARLGKTLLQALQQQAAVTFCCPAEVVDAAAVPGGMRIEYEYAGERHRCESRLLVIADGGRSGLCQQLQLDRVETSYQQSALIANLSLDRPHQQVAYERFSAEGPMALLPLTDDAQGRARSALVWTVPLEQADELLGLEDAEFIRRLQERFGYRAGRITALGERHCYPLQRVLACEQVRTGLAVLGNAAHSLHPVAGQGFNLAFRGAMVLAQELLLAQSEQRPLGSLDTLQRFQSQLRWDQTKTLGFSDQISKLFSNPRAAPVLARNLGLLGLELVAPFKHAFAQSAMGLDMPLPRLER
ncbi:MAG: 2-octaprenyl-6-methoxyphenol hydroxylase [Motiliproteus sp.]|jgi:2-octaprenyl-6-methoxyphenol hydroxylase